MKSNEPRTEPWEHHKSNCRRKNDLRYIRMNYIIIAMPQDVSYQGTKAALSQESDSDICALSESLIMSSFIVSADGYVSSSNITKCLHNLFVVNDEL